QMVYNFALPPLVLFSFQNGNAEKLTKWASTITKISNSATYFNFLDSHDGVGVMAVKNILTKKEIENMALKVLEHGGYISYKKEGDGTLSPYELNTTWFSAINREDDNESVDLQMERYVATRSIALAFMGVPGVYLHGLLGSKNDAEAVLMEKSRRSINRRNIKESELLEGLENQKAPTFKIAFGLIVLIQIRKMERAFHPNSPQKVLNLSNSLFTLMRVTPDSKEIVLAITNVTNSKQQITIKKKDIGVTIYFWRDLVSGNSYESINGEVTLEFEPYQVAWLKGVNL
ncbi:MAG: sugar phosphorylase, partial [Calditrichia bacterium]|nr:sugar phosphorylase [Calditrichia bacterium]